MSSTLNTPFTSTWTLEEARSLFNQLTPIAKTVGFAVGLTGGVLRNGHSDHDLDVVFYPLKAPAGAVAELRGALKAFGMQVYLDRQALQDSWELKGNHDEKWVEVWQHEGRRVDVFFLR